MGTQSLVPGERVALAQGVELVLASRARLRLVDDSAPHLVATSPDGEVRVASNDILLLPSDEQPELSIYRELDTWVVESDTGLVPASEQDTLIAGGKAWRLMLPSVVPETRELEDSLHLHDFDLRFRVSRDGEHVELVLAGFDREIEVETRAHLLLLLLLARVRIQDAERGLPDSECGWIYRDQLPKQLGVEPHMLNLWVHRARKQLASFGVRDAASVIERRANATQMRIGARRLEVVAA